MAKGILPFVRSMSKRLVLSYIVDCIIIVIFLAIAAVFSRISPNKRPFSPVNPSISYPYLEDTISITTVGLVGVVAPAAIILLICLVVIPGPSIDRSTTPRSLIWRRKLWEWFTGWLGLGLSIALSFFLTQGMKNLFGKHRPDFLARCNPDFTQIRHSAVGIYGDQTSENVPLVSWESCRSKDGSGVGLSEFEDGFRSFPSGHCTIAFAGLIYLTLFLAAKFSVTIPSLVSFRHTPDSSPHTDRHTHLQSPQNNSDVSLRNRAAAPPLYLLIPIFIPVGAAIYIASTRYSDYKHEGFDVLFSSLEGILCAWFAFRWYHLPVRRGAGWSWGPRTQNRAFAVGVGVGCYVGPEGWEHLKDSVNKEDLESARGVDGEGIRCNEREQFEMAEFAQNTAIGSDSSQRGLRE